jgi:hypothetical protein
MLDQLAAYLFTFIVTATHVPGETAWPWARAAADACGTATAPRTCLRFVAQAVAEGGFHEAVLSGRCNDPAWRLRQRGSWWALSCDEGHAAGPWQVHPADIHASAFDLRTPAPGAKLAFGYWMRTHGGAWTTRARAEVIADAWLRSHPLAF